MLDPSWQECSQTVEILSDRWVVLPCSARDQHLHGGIDWVLRRAALDEGGKLHAVRCHRTRVLGGILRAAANQICTRDPHVLELSG